MSAFVLECPFPGATTCVVVGRLDAGQAAHLRSYRRALWLVESDAPTVAVPDLNIERMATPAPDDPALERSLDRFVGRDPRRLPTLLVSRSAPEALVRALQEQLESHHRARVTRQKDGFLWQQHVLENLPAYLRGRVPANWAGALSGRAAFICGAGPSLDVSAPALARHAHQGVVLSADSAVRALTRHGVVPDFVVSTDVAKLPPKCLPADAPPPPRIVLSTLSPPSWWREAAPGRCLFLSGRQITEDWMASLGAMKTAAAVTENCGATALELARYLGCGPIYLFGMDLALDEGAGARRHHSDTDASTYANSGFVASQAFPRVTGNTAPTVPTHVLGDWRALDARLASWPAGLVVNVTDRGARLRNTVVCAPSDFDPPGLASAPPLEQMLPWPEPKPDVEVHLDRVRDVAARGASLAQRAKERIARGDIAGAAVVLRQAMIDPELSRLLGAYALKSMPHLVPPLEGEADQWRTLIGEFQSLVDQARQL